MSDSGAIRSSPRRRGPVWTGLLVVVAGVSAFAWLMGVGLRHDPRVLPSALAGRPAPAFELRDMDTGRSISLDDFKGRPVVINFWASWCTECRKEHPNFVTAWNRYRDRGIALMGIVFQDSEGSARAVMEELGGDWPTLLDPGSRTAIDYGVYGVPETFFIDRRGIVAYKEVGGLSYAELVDHIEPLLEPAR